MKVALVMPPAAAFDIAQAQRIIATALLVAGTGEHTVALMVPCQPPALAVYVSHITRHAGAPLYFRPYALPMLSVEADTDSDHAYSLIWTRFLQEQEADLIMVFHDIRTGRLRCMSRLAQALVAFVGAEDVDGRNANLPERGISPQIIVASAATAQRLGQLWHHPFFTFIDIQAAEAKPAFRLPSMRTPLEDSASHASVSEATALFGPTVLSELVRQATNLLQERTLARSVAPPREHAYRVMVDGLRPLSRPKLELVNYANAIAFNEGPGDRSQLLLDISVIVHGDARSGIQRVVRSLLVELICSPPVNMDVRPIHFLTGEYLYANAYAHRIGHGGVLPEKDTHVDFRPGDKYLSLDLNTHLVEPAQHAFLDMQARGVSLNFVVYDILLVRHPEWWKPGLSESFERWLRSIATLADTLMCISQTVATDVREWVTTEKLRRYGTPRVASFHLGADVASSLPSTGMPADAQIILDAIGAAPSFLMVGTIEPRKGHVQALAAFELLWSKNVNCQLVLVGSAGWLVEELVVRLNSHPERGRRLIWLEGISDELLQGIYDVSTCLLAASLGEGFGLPIIEGAKSNLPVLARALPVFREVAGEHAFYFDGTDPQILAIAVQEWLALYDQGAAPDPSQLKYLTWKESAQQLMDNLITERTIL